MDAAEGYFLFLLNRVLTPDRPGLQLSAMEVSHTGRMIVRASMQKGQRMLGGPLSPSDVTVARAKGSWRVW